MTRFTNLMLAIFCVAVVCGPAYAAQNRARHDRQMREMAQDPHHVLAMAYRENLTMSAKSLRTAAGRAETMNVEVARTLVAEMRRSFDLMDEHREDHLDEMTGSHRSRMSSHIAQMDTKIAALEGRIEVLERAVSYSSMDARSISELSGRIVRDCDRMMDGHASPRVRARRTRAAR